MLRNLNSYDKYTRKHRKKHSYNIALRALFEGRDKKTSTRRILPFTYLSGLKKKNQCWDRMSVHD
jgi:hypothetical protein